ncbi:histidine phosphatase family protein [Undibacterium flavidum]|uniref:Histidine phosphatase family protein n=1 Tax=Undibacterium flavidum TaxID=2762297 RepID=A0ABR6Y8E9_9BURK|nr:histidine phosphatase family protein [Undibacterium flavidum]MBC3872893.1 histidine phosphatase family protein [Undibacterium flavidum]
MKNLLNALLFIIACQVSAAAWSQTIFIVRHGEKVDESRDPQLSLKGKQRAANLAMQLRDADIKRVYVTEFQRTQMTAAPLVDARQLALTPYAAKESASFGKTLLTAEANTLVVGHSNTLLDILKGMGITDVKPVADDEYDRLIIVTLNKNGSPSYILLRY